MSEVRRATERRGTAPLETALPTLSSLDELARYVLQEPDICLRYSAGPLEDRERPSVDYESGLLLPGLSAVSLRPEPWWTRDRRDWIARQVNHYIHLTDGADDRRAWLLIGRIAGYGPDREPLLWPWSPVAWLDNGVLEEARSVYERNFDAGRDSRGG
ncbi:MAG TPA: DUF6098 family protein [Actinomycetota bacterium]|nr:DUF6098 family protein [Actinomycetota bacterium]